MEGAILTMIIVSPIACCIGIYKIFNHGHLPCMNTSDIDKLNKVIPEN
jgi:hypothetical protein